LLVIKNISNKNFSVRKKFKNQKYEKNLKYFRSKNKFLFFSIF